MEKVYECIVIGMGPAAQSAAVFMGRAKLKVLMIGKLFDSSLMKGKDIGNYLCCGGKSGPELLRAGLQHAKKYGAEALEDEIVDVRKKGVNFLIKTAKLKDFLAKTIIIATGLSYQSAGFVGEKEFTGNGVHYCVACDGPLFAGKTVIVIGNGNYAAEEAIQLSSFTKDITIFSNGQKFNFSPEIEALMKKNKIKLSEETIVECTGKNLVEKIKTDKTEKRVNGIFVAIGKATALAFANKLALATKEDYIVVDRDGKTSIEGVYAAGGCTGGNYQMAVSVGEGCNAAISVIKKLKGLEVYSDLT